MRRTDKEREEKKREGRQPREEALRRTHETSPGLRGEIQENKMSSIESAFRAILQKVDFYA